VTCDLTGSYLRSLVDKEGSLYSIVATYAFGDNTPFLRDNSYETKITEASDG
jgi:hypothetical protein